PHIAGKIAAERRVPHAFESCAAMLGANIEIDVVSVASPPFAHCDDVLSAFAAGKHVLCEKPMALNVTQAEHMAAAGRAAGTARGLAHEFRFISQRQALKELIANGHLGALRTIEITEMHDFLRAGGDRPNNWWFSRKSGGGITGAWFSHMIDLSNWLAERPPLRTYGFERTANPRRRDASGEFTSDVADGSFALLDYGDGLVSRLACEATARVRSSTVAAHGEMRSAVASGENALEVRLFAVDEDETSELDCSPLHYEKLISLGANVPMFMALLDELQAQIETGKSALPTFEGGVITQRVLEKVGYSA
ncbi:MAG: Gfo/Idh/MocA family oxidoreductase, partial [Candidatus Eremiobacteraeota bacterium]|nr:Gfo/Idh/MocA family oxidoreductase [Candidatus Eremiobacteraeota bacterium]